MIKVCDLCLLLTNASDRDFHVALCLLAREFEREIGWFLLRRRRVASLYFRHSPPQGEKKVSKVYYTIFTDGWMEYEGTRVQ